MKPLAMPTTRHRRWRTAGAVLLGVLVAGGVGEWLGWPFLAAPLQNALSSALDRRITIDSAASPEAPDASGFQVRFLGGLRLTTPRLEIAAPAWSTTPHMLVAQGMALKLRYVDLWRAYRGQPVRIESLQARTLDGNLERQADGRASWQFGSKPPSDTPTERTRLPLFGQLLVNDGVVRYKDVPLGADLQASISLAQLAPGDAVGPQTQEPTSVLKVQADGRYRNQPLKIMLATTAVLPSTETDDVQALPVALALDATVGRAQLTFKGSAKDVLKPDTFAGRFSIKGPSLAAVGDPVGVTLPTTPAFRSEGSLVKQGSNWQVVVDDATVGASRLKGAFTYDAGRSTPLLSGRLGGSRLLLADLGPVVGTTPAATADTAEPLQVKARGKGKVLPDRPFDLPAMRAMDANVLIDIGEVDLNTKLLQPLKPLSLHLQLVGGVLTLRDLVARTAQGQLRGDLTLDGRAATALWNADLRWDGVRLEQWLQQTRAKGLPPYVAGKLQGRAVLTGQGRSTAEILASLKGQFRTELRDGAVSHLGVELAGIDLAESLGMLIKGDDALPVQCAVADLAVDGGVFRPRAMVVDTVDSAVWIDGSLSLATEEMDLRAVVVPKDFSPLTLRTPLRVRGSFSDPQTSLEKGPLGAKVAAAVLLGLVNPFAALIPFIDVGDNKEAERDAVGCRGLKQRVAAVAAARPPAVKK